MSPALSDRVLRVAWSLPLALPPLRAERRSVTVLYHGVPTTPHFMMSGTVFEQHILFLKRHFDFKSPHDVSRSRSRSGRPHVLLTFDDGFRNNAEVVAPILREHRVPALFFVSSRHATAGKYLWFAYLEALQNNFRWNRLRFRDTDYDMSAGARDQSVGRLRQALLALKPHPAAMYRAIEDELPPLEEFVSVYQRADAYAGMTAEQVGELASDPLFAVGVHTTDHPFLTRCEPAEARRQIDDNRRWLERATGQPCDRMAYPAGDYDTTIMQICMDLRFRQGFAVAPRAGGHSSLEQSRIGIYSASTDVLGFKVQWGHVLRQVRIPVG